MKARPPLRASLLLHSNPNENRSSSVVAFFDRCDKPCLNCRLVAGSIFQRRHPLYVEKAKHAASANIQRYLTFSEGKESDQQGEESIDSCPLLLSSAPETPCIDRSFLPCCGCFWTTFNLSKLWFNHVTSQESRKVADELFSFPASLRFSSLLPLNHTPPSVRCSDPPAPSPPCAFFLRQPNTQQKKCFIQCYVLWYKALNLFCHRVSELSGGDVTVHPHGKNQHLIILAQQQTDYGRSPLKGPVRDVERAFVRPRRAHPGGLELSFTWVGYVEAEWVAFDGAVDYGFMSRERNVIAVAFALRKELRFRCLLFSEVKKECRGKVNVLVCATDSTHMVSISAVMKNRAARDEAPSLIVNRESLNLPPWIRLHRKYFKSGYTDEGNKREQRSYWAKDKHLIAVFLTFEWTLYTATDDHINLLGSRKKKKEAAHQIDSFCERYTNSTLCSQKVKHTSRYSWPFHVFLLWLESVKQMEAKCSESPTSAAIRASLDAAPSLLDLFTNRQINPLMSNNETRVSHSATVRLPFLFEEERKPLLLVSRPLRRLCCAEPQAPLAKVVDAVITGGSAACTVRHLQYNIEQ
ncbi:hypothetical protein JOB18_007610 [Solea senegalensis]|uniref:Uncharacterized protein n=1 Tax=Solea senegalensis TaxID=28829 RepID=A0AAV6QDK4_SOLSE|nr:hypothetical protein JOB18_007610 [Solea senegalensis]